MAILQTKTCTKCGKEKDLESFYRDSGKKDGLSSHCKSCRNAYEQTKDRKEAKRRYHTSERGRARRRKNCAIYNRTEKGKATARRHGKRWRNKNQDKIAAHKLLNSTIKTGEIVRPKCCEECGNKCRPHGHHEDYSKPLDVLWLCRACHMKKHDATDTQDDQSPARD